MELRYLQAAELRTAGPSAIEGYAAVFGVRASIGGYYEQIQPSAFRRALNEGQDVRCLFNHNASNLLGRTKAGTLELEEDSTGLHFVCNLPQTNSARDLHQLIQRGDIDGCSFSFNSRDDAWTDERMGGERVRIRTLRNVDLYDVGPVTYAAYGGTSVSARSWNGDSQGLVGVYTRPYTDVVTAAERARLLRELDRLMR